MNIFLQCQGKTSVVNADELHYLLRCNEDDQSDMLFMTGGRLCDFSTVLYNNQTILMLPKLPGGKGGFGAKLKTEGGKKVRPN